jgi:hypothetical protein
VVVEADLVSGGSSWVYAFATSLALLDNFAGRTVFERAILDKKVIAGEERTQSSRTSCALQLVL